MTPDPAPSPDRNHDLDRLQREFGAWAVAVFPTSTPASIAAHLADEVAELAAAENHPLDAPGGYREEAADCLLLLLDLAHRLGFSLWDAALAKSAVAQRRAYGPADARGVIRHLDDDRDG